MNDHTPSDQELRNAYQAYSTDHEAQREALMKAIAAEALPTGDSPTPPSRRWVLWSRSVAAIAAMLLLVVSVPFVWNATSHKAYGMDGLPQRLLAIRSLHMQGFLSREIVNEDGETESKTFPTRYYFERPNKCWIEHYGFSDPGSGKPTIVRRVNIGIDGHAKLTHDLASGRKLVESIDPRMTELQVELMIQSQMLEQLMNASADAFKKVSSEQVAGVVCDVYEAASIAEERQLGSTQRIWLNPRNGLPVRVESSDGEQELVSTLEKIELNVDAPADLFPLVADVDTPPRRPEGIDSVSSSAAGPVRMGAWHSLRLSPTKALVCWTQHDLIDNEKHWFAREPEFTLASNTTPQALTVETLREFVSKDVHWRWSLVRTAGGTELGHRDIRATVTHDNGVTAFEVKPLQFSDDRLPEVFDFLQAVTPGESGSNKLTLQSLTR